MYVCRQIMDQGMGQGRGRDWTGHYQNPIPESKARTLKRRDRRRGANTGQDGQPQARVNCYVLYCGMHRGEEAAEELRAGRVPLRNPRHTITAETLGKRPTGYDEPRLPLERESLVVSG